MKKFIVLLSLILTMKVFADSPSLDFEDFESAQKFFIANFEIELNKFIDKHLDTKTYKETIYICAEAKETCTGNMLLKDIAKHFHEVYSALPLNQKYLMGSIAFEVLYEDYNARFLKLSENFWLIMSREEAEELLTTQFQKAAFEPPASKISKLPGS